MNTRHRKLSAQDISDSINFEFNNDPALVPPSSYKQSKQQVRRKQMTKREISRILSRCPVSHWQCLVRSLCVLEFTHLDMQRSHNWFSRLSDELAAFSGMCSSGDQDFFSAVLCIPSPGYLGFNSLLYKCTWQRPLQG